MVRCLIFLFAALLVGCQPAYVHGLPNERSAYFRVPVGSKFELTSRILVPPLTDSIYFQKGALPVWYNVDKYSPYCVLRLNAASKAERVIKPDTFAVTKISTAHLFRLAARARRARFLPVAATGADVAAADDNSGSGDGYEAFGSVMQLHSARQPEVKQMTCAAWGLPQRGTFITVQQIRQALGRYFRIDLLTK